MPLKTINRFICAIIVGVCVLSTTSSVDAFVYQDRFTLSKSLAHFAMGQMYEMSGDTSRAIFEYETAAQYDDKSYSIRLRLGASYARLGLLAKAKEQLSFVNVYKPDEIQSHYLLALIYSTEKDYDKAAREYELILNRFTEVEPENVEIYGYLGQLYYSQKKYNAAIEQFEKILILEPENPDVLYLLGSLYIEIEKDKKAISLLKKSISIDPNHDGSLNSLGYLYAENNENLDEALKLVGKALEISPENGAYLDSLGWVYFKRAEYENALQHFKLANELIRDPVIYDHLGDAYYKLNKIEDAVAHWELSLEMQPDQEKVQKKINDIKNTQASR